ncbi:MAG: hypothetical protein DWP98_13490 [Bacteroidetes bacterium]|nr:MAG: hypothetical protein DWP98_13490 [Bacteroidota bacterium]MBL1145020.1 hypothetical protein [Bacteroidota bacterium]NOG57817.1 hypothetical protein [Bacteroidota bacterium]
MKANYINYNGQLILEKEISLKLNRAMRFGDGMFETIRVINGKPVWWDEHYFRLKSGLEYLSIKIPDLFSEELLVDALSVLNRNQLKGGGILRILIYRKGSAGYTPTNYDFDYIIESDDLENNFFELNKKGLKVDISETVHISPSEDLAFKSLNKIPYIRASIEKTKRGFDDLLIKNTSGSIIDSCSSAVFLVKNNSFYTPKLSAGALNSVTRNKLLKFLKERTYKVYETSITTKQIEAADELLLLNSIHGVRWVGFYKKSRYFHRKANEIIAIFNNNIS